MAMTITLSPSEAHLLLAVLDEAFKGQAFPIAAYGMTGEAQIAGLSSRVSEAIRRATRPLEETLSTPLDWEEIRDAIEANVYAVERSRSAK